MSDDETRRRAGGDDAADAPRKAKKTARVLCAGGGEFWTTQKQFWAWAREGMLTYVGDRPLTGTFEGRRERLIVMINHTLLDASAPNHKAEVLGAHKLQRPLRPRYPKPPHRKRSR